MIIIYLIKEMDKIEIVYDYILLIQINVGINVTILVVDIENVDVMN